MSAALAVAVAGCDRRQVVEGFPGEFVGVGLELRLAGGAPEVIRVLPGGAAAEAGILAADRIVAVDGVPTEGKSLGDVVMSLRGAPRTQVAIAVERAAERIVFVVQRRAMRKTAGDYAPTDAARE